ncbi:MAG TPA: hypothetical protein VGN57_04805 [Pirellulaceae bacterium]|jgi:hypothetical protein|nr:hypothetical protein [Pirellulaceae bacterium]
MSSPMVVTAFSPDFDFDFDFRIPDPSKLGESYKADSVPKLVVDYAAACDGNAFSLMPVPLPPKKRVMEAAALLGKHIHVSNNGIRVYIWVRGGAFLATGRQDGVHFGPTLGRSVEDSERELRRLLQELEDGTFRRPSEAKRKRPQQVSVRLSIAQVIEGFLESTRRRLGVSTFRTYRSRVSPLQEFAEVPAVKRRWRAAQEVDQEFANEFVDWLFQRPVHPNGHPNAAPKLRTPDNVRRSLETVSAVFRHAKKAKSLPLDFENPFAEEIMPVASARDPVRRNPAPLADRIRMVELMDGYELLHLMLPFVLGVRPEDFCTRLISDVDLTNGSLRFYSRFGGADFSKGRVDFALPFPAPLAPLVQLLMSGRSEGPLLRRRNVWTGTDPSVSHVDSTNDIAALIDRQRTRASADVRCGRDVKDVFQRVVRDLGGLSVDQLRSLYLRIRERAGLPRKRLYDLKHAVTIELTGSGVKQISATYLTGHRIPSRDVMARYDAVDPDRDVAPYFAYAAPLFDAMLVRAAELRTGQTTLSV